MVLKCSIADMMNDQTLQSTLLEYFHFPKMDTGKTFNVFYLTCWLRVCLFFLEYLVVWPKTLHKLATKPLQRSVGFVTNIACALHVGWTSAPFLFLSLLHCYQIFILKPWTWLQTPPLINYANYWNPYLYSHNSSYSYACVREIRPTLSQDLPTMQIVSILILHPRSRAPTTISVPLLSSQLRCCCCVLRRQMLFALFIL